MRALWIVCLMVSVLMLLGTMGCQQLTKEEKDLVISLRDQAIDWHNKAGEAMTKAEAGTITLAEGKELAAFYRDEARVAEDRIKTVIDSAGERGLAWYEILGGIIGAAVLGTGGGVGVVRAWRGSILERKGDIGKT